MGKLSLSLFLSPLNVIQISGINVKKKKEWKVDWKRNQIEKVRKRWKVKIEEAIKRATRGTNERNTKERREGTTWEFLTNPALPLIVTFSSCAHVFVDMLQDPSISFPL